jgi:DNA mismatch repair protein MutS
VRGEGALAWTDISTGEINVMPCPPVRLGPELFRLSVGRCWSRRMDGRATGCPLVEAGASVTPLGPGSFDSTIGGKTAFGAVRRRIARRVRPSPGPRCRRDGGAVDYLEITQKGKLPLLRPPRREFGPPDADRRATRRNLELTRSMAGARQGAFCHAIDRTVTAGGARLLERRLSGPSTRCRR